MVGSPVWQMDEDNEVKQTMEVRSTRAKGRLRMRWMDIRNCTNKFGLEEGDVPNRKDGEPRPQRPDILAGQGKKKR